jgi:hypothetical protein
MPKPSSPVIWPIWISAVAALLLGAGAGAWWITVDQKPQLEAQQKRISELGGRVDFLKSVLISQSEFFAKLDEAPPSSEEPLSVAPATSAQYELVNKAGGLALRSSDQLSRSPQAPAPKKEATKPAPARAEIAVAIGSDPDASGASKPHLNTAQEPADLPTSEPAPKPSGADIKRIEGVSMAKAGIKHLWADAVDFRSGLRVRVGEKFPSGEELISVDPTVGRIVTSQRQILILE